MSDPVAACLEGRLTPAMAIARLLLWGEEPVAIFARVAAARAPGEPWAALHALASDAAALARLHRMIEAARVDHAEPATPAAVAAMFDRAVAVSPEASVAFYSLGDPARLAAATGEIVAWLRDTALLGAEKEVLDLGCGIGRVAAAIAPHVRSVHGVDTSSGMVREARRRCAGVSNVSFAVSAGHDLAALGNASFDLILAIDSIPYLVQSDVADRHMRDASRVLKPGGAIVALNLAYGGDNGLALARGWTERYSLTLEVHAAPFHSWDGMPFIFRQLGRSELTNVTDE